MNYVIDERYLIFEGGGASMAAVDDAGEGAAEGWGEDAELIIDEGTVIL